MATADVIYNPGVVLSASDYYRALAVSRIGAIAAPQNVEWEFWDLAGNTNSAAIPSGFDQAVTGTSAGTVANNDEAGGVHQATTGGTAGSAATYRTESASIRAVGTAPWYFCGRIKVTTAIDNVAKCWCGLQNIAQNSTIGAGVFGPNSIVNFCVQYDGNEVGSFIDLGVAIDTAYHVFELWGFGDGKLHAAIDFGADKGPVSFAAAPTDSCFGLFRAINGATAAARTMRTDFLGIMAKRT